MRGQKNNPKSGARRFSFFYGKLVIHPLFLLFGVWHAVTGELLVFFSLVLCAIAHELAHAAEAAKHGFASKTILLMPYGATIDIDLNGVHPKDELRISIAGPLCNLLIAVFFLALSIRLSLHGNGVLRYAVFGTLQPHSCPPFRRRQNALLRTLPALQRIPAPIKSAKASKNHHQNPIRNAVRHGDDSLYPQRNPSPTKSFTPLFYAVRSSGAL